MLARVRVIVSFAFALIATAALAQQPQIRWEAFPLAGAPLGLQAQLGRLTLPLVRSRPAAGTIELAFVRLRAEGSAGVVGYCGLMCVPPLADVQTIAVVPEARGE